MGSEAVGHGKGAYVASHFEDGADVDVKTSQPRLKLDDHGLPLVPQPSDHKDDPLVSLFYRGVHMLRLM